jgi:hypothetical protein
MVRRLVGRLLDHWSDPTCLGAPMSLDVQRALFPSCPGSNLELSGRVDEHLAGGQGCVGEGAKVAGASMTRGLVGVSCLSYIWPV